MSTLENATTGERTKFKAITKYVQEKMWAEAGKEEGDAPDAAFITSVAAVLKSNKLTPTRPDRRFPNQNQVNNCW